jgi:hypothetical protein
MSAYREINRNPSRRDLLGFGLILLGGLGALAALCHFRAHKPTLALALGAAGAATFILSFVPPVGRRLYVAWMALGVTIGLFTSPVIMGLVYLIVMVPVAVILRIRGRDALRRKLDRGATSYWEDYPASDDPGRYVRQF